MEVDAIPLGMLNAAAYCERRFVYEFVLGEMVVNHHVREGALRHGPRAHQPGSEAGGLVRRSVHLHSARWRIYGVIDFVEAQAGVLVPVEYKKGRQGPWQSDAVQLCAAGLCIEEWQGISVPYGEIFYYGSRHRRRVEFDDDLRTLTVQTIDRAFALAEAAHLPPPLTTWAKCRDCSLEPICLPRETLKLHGAG